MKNKKKDIIAIAAVILVAAGVFMAKQAGNSADTIKIGVYLPLTGKDSVNGNRQLDGIKLAYEDENEVLGKKIKLVIEDNESDKIAAAQCVRRLVSRDKANAIIGTYGSSFAMAGGDVAEELHVPMVGPSCTNQLVTEGKKYCFRACFADPFQGIGASQFALTGLKAKTAACLTDVTEYYSVGLLNFFERDFVENGGKIVAKADYHKGDADFREQLKEIIAKNPDVLFITGHYADAGNIISQARELGAKFAILGGDETGNPELIKIAGAASEGYCFTTFAYAGDMPNMSERQKKFTESWKKTYKDREPDALSACGYDAYAIIIDAIKRAGSAEPDKIRDALAQTKDFDAVTGKTTINERHDTIKPIGIARIVNGQRVMFTVVNPK